VPGPGCLVDRCISEMKKLLFNAELPAGVSTYRAYLLLWNPPS
jgi:hypothetical protein